MASTEISNKNNLDNANLDKAKLFLVAYSKIYPISHEEIRAGLKLYFLKTINGFWTESEHYLKNNTRVDHFLAPTHGRLKYFAENLDSLCDFFTA